MEQLEATILGTVFRNPENGWSVVTVRSGRSELTVVGSLPELSPGEQAVFSGEWIEHRTYGRQFGCKACELKVPTTLLGIERYLGSGLIHGVGPSTATLIVEVFGEDTLTILSEHPERLTEVKGIGKKRAAISASFTGTAPRRSSGRIPTVSATTWKASASKPRTGSACPSAFRRKATVGSAVP